MAARRLTLLACASNRRKPELAGYEGRPAELSRYPNRRAGRNRIARRSANKASNVIATTRNGSDRSHSKGQRTMARTANGQHNTNRRHQPTIASNTFTGVSPRFLGATLAYPWKAARICDRQSTSACCVAKHLERRNAEAIVAVSFQFGTIGARR